jgi:integrase/recombinase XerD
LTLTAQSQQDGGHSQQDTDFCLAFSVNRCKPYRIKKTDLLKLQKEQMGKNNRHGQAEIWADNQLEMVNRELSPKMRTLLAVCYYTLCRVSEARQLRAEDLINHTIVFRRATTKTKKTRTVPIHPRLQQMLNEADLPPSGYLFPGRGDKPITRQAVDAALRDACDLLGLAGFSTHSCRRTGATRLNSEGVPLRVIQEIGGWSSLAALQRYLEVSPHQMKDAIARLS